MERIGYDGLEPVATGYINRIEHALSGAISFTNIELVPEPRVPAWEYRRIITGDLPSGLEGSMVDLYEDRSNPDVMRHIIETASGFRIGAEVPRDFVRDPEMTRLSGEIPLPPKRSRWWSRK